MRRRLAIALRNRRRWTHERRVDGAFVGGLALVAIGFGMFSPPLGLIVGGALMVSVAWRAAGGSASWAARTDGDRDEVDD